jgi:UDP-N-acetylmuramoylalanine--D-glutamate ligase
VVWILGGLLKGVDISKLVSEFGKSVRAAIVIGKDRSEILRAFQEHAPDTEVFEVSETESATLMRTVVRHARAVALPGDTVLLAPAAASMDQFIDYVDRGQAYKEAVLESYGAREE